MTVNKLFSQLLDYSDDIPVILSFYNCDPWSTYYTITETKVEKLGDEWLFNLSIEDIKKNLKMLNVKELVSAICLEDNAAKSVYVHRNGLLYPVDRARTQIMNEHTPDAKTYCVLDIFH